MSVVVNEKKKDRIISIMKMIIIEVIKTPFKGVEPSSSFSSSGLLASEAKHFSFTLLLRNNCGDADSMLFSNLIAVANDLCLSRNFNATDAILYDGLRPTRFSSLPNTLGLLVDVVGFLLYLSVKL